MSNLTFFFVLLGVCTFTRGLFWEDGDESENGDDALLG